MNENVLDTNVLLVASAADPSSHFKDSDHVPPEERLAVLEWLNELHANVEQRIVLDDAFRIYDEYRNKLTDQDYGLQVIGHKMQTARFVDLPCDDDGHAVVPEAFQTFDRSDRKFLAAALTDPEAIAIVNAADTDWLYFEEQLEAAGVKVIHVIEAWLREQKAKK